MDNKNFKGCYHIKCPHLRKKCIDDYEKDNHGMDENTIYSKQVRQFLISKKTVMINECDKLLISGRVSTNSTIKMYVYSSKFDKINENIDSHHIYDLFNHTIGGIARDFNMNKFAQRTKVSYNLDTMGFDFIEIPCESIHEI